MIINRKRSKKADVKMIPLIDCLFLILVFFIYAMLSMVVQKGIPVNLPKAVSAEMNKDEYESITITASGQTYLNKQFVTITELRESLESIPNKPEVKIFINADRDARHGRVLEVLDMIRDAGMEKVSFEIAEPVNDES